MTQRHTLSLLFMLLGSLLLLPSLPSTMKDNLAFAGQVISNESLQAIEAVHKRNIDQLHGLHHEMRATLKQWRQDRSEQEAAQHLATQLQAVSQTLDVVAATEKEHPQWAGSWSHRHARLMVLTQEMETLLLTELRGRETKR